MDRIRSWLGLMSGNIFTPYLVGTFVAAAIVALALPIALGVGLTPAIVWPVGLTLLAVALFFVVLFAVIARRERRQITDLLAGEIWARWAYPAADEERLAAKAWRQTQSTTRQTLGSAVLASLIVGGTMALSGHGAVISAAIGGGLAGFMLLIALTIYLRGQRRFEHRRLRSREVIFGPRALLRDGAHLQLWGQKTRLDGVTVDLAGSGESPAATGQPLLRIDRRIKRRSSTSTSSDLWWLELLAAHSYWAKVTTEIPVPSGKEAEAEALAERYRHTYSLASGQQPSPATAAGPRAGLSVRPS